MRLSRLSALAVFAILLSGCASPAPGATPSATASPRATRTPRPSPTSIPTPTPYAYPMRLEEVGHIGGDADALALSGDRLYVQTGSDHFIVVDVSDPTRPAQIGRSHPVEGGISTLAAYEQYVLIGDRFGHLQVFDVSDDETPAFIEVLELGDQIVEFIVDGPYAYAAVRTKGVLIFDLAAPGGPKLIATIPVEGRARRVAKTGNVLVVGSVVVGAGEGGSIPFESDYDNSLPYGAKTNTMSIVDVSDPAKPDVLNSLKTSALFDADRMLAADNQVRLEDGSTYDISDPTAPSFVKEDTWWFPDAIAGSYALRYNDYHEESPVQQILFIYDMSASPDESESGASESHEVINAIGALPEDIVSTSQRLVARGSYVYLADRQWVRIFDLTRDPQVKDRSKHEMPDEHWWREAGSLDTDMGTRMLGGGMYFYPQPFCIVGEHLYTGKGVWSLEQPGAPRLLGKNAGSAPDCDGFAIQDGIMVWGRSDGMMLVIDLRDPANPITTAVFLSQEPGRILGASDTRLFRLAPDDSKEPATGTLQVFDITDPYKPELLSSIESMPSYGDYDSFKAIGDHGFWNHYDDDGSIVITVDASNPAEIKRANGYSPLVEAETGGGYAYVGGENVITIYRVDDLAAPPDVFELPANVVFSQPESGIASLKVFGDRLYAARRARGGIIYADILDISDPAHPKTLAAFDKSPYQIAVFGDTIYFNLLYEGISIYRLVPN